MSIKAKRAIRATAFFLLLFFVIYQVQNLVEPKFDWPTRNRRSRKSIGSVFNEPANTLDVIYLGGSQTFCSIIPMDIYDATGIHSYNLASIAQRVPVGNYLLQAALKKQSPKLVVIDASGFFYTKDEINSPGKWREIIDIIPTYYLKEKLDMINALAEIQGKSGDWDFILTCLIPLMRYHSNYALEYDSFINLHMNQLYQRKGYVASAHIRPVTDERIEAAKALLEGVDPSQSKEREIKKIEGALSTNKPYLQMLHDMCEKNGAELVFIKVPVCADAAYRGYWSQKKHDMVQALADELGVKFMDMNYAGLDMDWKNDSHDGGVHLNYAGAKKVSAYLGQWLSETFDFGSAKNEKLEAQWAYQSDLCAREMEYYALGMERNFQDYLDRLEKGNYTLFTTVSNGLGDYWSDEDQKRFSEVTGGTLDLRQPENAAYLSVSVNGKLVKEKGDAESCSYRRELEDGTQYKVVSKAGAGDNNGTVRIWGKNYSDGSQGLHIVVYDNELGCAVDSVCFDMTTEGQVGTHSTKYESNMRLKLIDYVYKVMKKM